MHKNVSCDNTLVVILRLGNLRVVLHRVPVFNSHCVIFPMRPEHSTALRPCAALACIAAPLEGIEKPYDFVKYIEETRRKGGRSGFIYDEIDVDDDEEGDGERAPVPPPDSSIQVRPLRVFANPDGGLTAVIPLSEHAKPELSAEERARLGKPMLRCVKEGLAVAGIDPRRVFGSEYEPGDEGTRGWGMALVEFGLVALLLEAVAPGCDVAIGVMPEGRTEGAFTFLHLLPAECPTVPLLGLTHGDMRPVQRVEESYKILTADPTCTLSLSAAAPLGDEAAATSSGADVPLSPLPLSHYVADHFTHDESELSAVCPSLRHVPVHTGERGPHTHGNTKWAQAQATFQQQMLATACERIDDALQSNDELVQALQGTPEVREEAGAGSDAPWATGAALATPATRERSDLPSVRSLGGLPRLLELKGWDIPRGTVAALARPLEVLSFTDASGASASFHLDAQSHALDYYVGGVCRLRRLSEASRRDRESAALILFGVPCGETDGSTVITTPVEGGVLAEAVEDLFLWCTRSIDAHHETRREEKQRAQSEKAARAAFFRQAAARARAAGGGHVGESSSAPRRQGRARRKRVIEVSEEDDNDE